MKMITHNQTPKMTQQKIWINGALVNEQDANVPMLSHSLHYGSGVFEGIRFYETENGPAIFRVKEHIDRLFYSAKAFDYDVDYSYDDILNAMKEVIQANNLTDGYIRPLIFYGEGNLGVNPTGAKMYVIIAAWAWGKYFANDGLAIKTSDIIRIHPQSTDVCAKISGVYQNSIQAGLSVKKHGYDDALLLDFEGNIAEGPSANFFMVKDNTLYTPKTGSILPGITRATIIQIAKDSGYEVVEKELTLDDAYVADEAFFCGTAAEVTPILAIDDKKLGDGTHPIATKLQKVYGDVVRGKKPEYMEWLVFV